MLEFHWFYKGQGSRGAAEGAEGAEAGGGRGRGPKSALFAPKLLFRKNAKIPQKCDFFAKMRLWTPKVHFRPQGAPKPLIFHWFNKPLRARARKAAFSLKFTLFSSFSHFGAKSQKSQTFCFSRLLRKWEFILHLSFDYSQYLLRRPGFRGALATRKS